MFDSLSNLLILLIPLAIFIGRMVVEARNKREGAPQIPVHFEDDDDEPPVKAPAPVTRSRTEGEFIPLGLREISSRNFQAASPAAKPVKQTRPALVTPPATPAAAKSSTHGTPTRQHCLPLHISRLPPLKQAVVMAEILGTPKALQSDQRP